MSNEVTKKTHRRGWIDYARGIVIIYVVYRHALTGLISAGIGIPNAIYMVQESSMPIFFIVSGVFIYTSALKRGFGDFAWFKFESLMYPYFIWGSIHLIVQILFSRFSNSAKGWDYFIYLITYPRAVDQFWYLYTLFAVMLVFAAINFLILKFKSLPNVVLAMALYLLSYFIETDYFALNDILFYYLFLVFGFMAAKFILPIDSNFFNGRWLLYVLPIFCLLQVAWYMRYVDARFLIDLDFAGFLLFMPITILGALILFVVVYKLEEINIMIFFKRIGSHSLYIYVMHLMFTAAIRIVLMKFFPDLHGMIMLWIIIAGGVLIPIVIYQVLIRLKMNWLFEPPAFIKKNPSQSHKPQ
jgi:fucose 4-O-acetylase-like acetyltransferase